MVTGSDGWPDSAQFERGGLRKWRNLRKLAEVKTSFRSFRSFRDA